MTNLIDSLPFFLPFSRLSTASMVLGIPTVKRESQSYLLPTLQSLIESMSAEEKNASLIIVFVAEVSFILTIPPYYLPLLT